MPMISAQEAQQAVRKQYGKARRELPRISKSTQASMKNLNVCIFNVGPWRHQKPLGDIGTYYIPSCPEDKEFVIAPLIPETWVFFYPEEVDRMKMMEDDGRYVAEQIIGEGAHLNPQQSLRQFGVGLAAGITPTKKEIQEAQEKLTAKFQFYVAEARSAAANGTQALERTISADRHYLAARRLGLTGESWFNYKEPVPREGCMNCGRMNDVGIVTCQCGFILDPEKYNSKEFQARLVRK